MANHCNRKEWKVHAIRVTLGTSNVIQETREIRETLATQGIPDMHRTTLRTQVPMALHHRSTTSTAAFVVSIDERSLSSLSVRSRR
jgi:hypothetical protein